MCISAHDYIIVTPLFQVTYDMEVHIESVSCFSLLAKMLYSENVKNSLESGTLPM